MSTTDADRGAGPDRVEIDLGAPLAVHVVAIGGSAMSGIATVLLALGHRVTGSDIVASPRIDALRARGVPVTIGHATANVAADVDLVVVSSAITEDNPEVIEARRRGLPVARRADAQRAIVATRRAIVVAGSHGKTTTTTMLTLILRDAGWDPSFLVGGDVAQLGATAAMHDGTWIVVEGDESDGTFLELGADAAIVTSVEADHLAHYGGLPGLERAFASFVAATPGVKVLCIDDPATARLAADLPADLADGVTYGFAAHATVRIDEYAGTSTGSSFVLTREGDALGSISLSIPGRHNALNAAGAAAMALALGAEFASVQRGLAAFGGLGRRFERRGERAGVTYVDDYAHLPGEVATMVSAAREGGWRRVVTVFQPHRYSRTAELWRDFADAFVGSDLVVLTEVYGFNEPVIEGVSGRLIVRAVLDAHPDQALVYLPTRADLITYVPTFASAGDLVLSLGAGDLTTLPEEWLAAESTKAGAS
ncbi:MAG: UDP-N-acetylmuramate--L-alanine ligase [Acidimicrobiia bacterium]